MEIFIKKSVLRTDKSKIFNQKYWLKKVAPQLQEYPRYNCFIHTKPRAVKAS